MLGEVYLANGGEVRYSFLFCIFLGLCMGMAAARALAKARVRHVTRVQASRVMGTFSSHGETLEAISGASLSRYLAGNGSWCSIPFADQLVVQPLASKLLVKRINRVQQIFLKHRD